MQAKPLYILAFILILGQGASAQAFQWAINANGGYGFSDGIAQGMSKNNIIGVGPIFLKTTFFPKNRDSVVFNLDTFYTYALSPEGNLLWIKKYPNIFSPNQATFYSITTGGSVIGRPNGNFVFIIILMGGQSLNFGKWHLSPSGISSIDQYIYMAEADSNGNLLNVKLLAEVDNTVSLGNDGGLSNLSFLPGPSGGFYLAGLFNNYVIAGNQTILGNNAIDPSVIIFYDSSGNYQWYSCENKKNLYAFWTRGKYIYSEYSTPGDTFQILKKDTNAKHLDSVTIIPLSGFTGPSNFTDYVNTGNSYNSYLSGMTFSKIKVGNRIISPVSNANEFMIKLDTSLRPLWINTLGSTGLQCEGSLVDTIENLINLVYFTDTLLLNNHAPIINIYDTFNSSHNGFLVLKYLNNGQLDYSIPINFTNGVMSTYALSMDKCGNLYIYAAWGYNNCNLPIKVDFGNNVTLEAPPEPLSSSLLDKSFIAKLYTGKLNFTYAQACSYDSLYAITEPNYDSIVWSFPDGTVQNGKKVRYNFVSPNYQVTFNAYCHNGCHVRFTDSVKNTGQIGIRLPLQISDTSGCTPLNVTILGAPQSAIKHYFYDFGNGQTDTLPNPKVIYTQPGTYKVSRKLTFECGTVKDSLYIYVLPGVAATTPSILSASVFPRTIKTSWLPLAGAAKYMVYLHTKGIDNLLATITDTAYYDSITPLSLFTNDSNYYFVRATDSCGNISGASSMAKPMVLTANNIENKYAIVNWTPYEKWQNGVAKYEVQVRQKNGSFIDYFDGPDTQYTDNDFFDSTQNERCYCIESFENAGNHATSFSNPVCIPYLPTLWVPTAFTPNGDGLNDVFKVRAIGLNSFNLKIYNAWGELVFQSGDKDKGWDGSFHGTPSPEGAYVYVIQGQNDKNKTIYQNGTLHLMK